MKPDQTLFESPTKTETMPYLKYGGITVLAFSLFLSYGHLLLSLAVQRWPMG